jgi:nitroreductase
MSKTARNDYPIHNLLKRRWSPRAFADRPVEPDKLRSLLEAARWAPSSYNEQPRAFIVATRDRPAQHTRVLRCLVEGNQAWAKAAPVLMVAPAHRSFERNSQANRHAYHDVGLAVGSLTVQATTEGLGVHQMAGILPDKVRTAFHVPDDWDAVTGIAIGYIVDPNSLPEPLRQRELAAPTRKPLRSFVFEGDWGTASALIPEAK